MLKIFTTEIKEHGSVDFGLPPIGWKLREGDIGVSCTVIGGANTVLRGTLTQKLISYMIVALLAKKEHNFFAGMGTIIPNFGSLSTVDKVKIILCPATNQAAKLTNQFIGKLFKERENIDKGANLQEDELNVSDSDIVFQSESSEDEM